LHSKLVVLKLSYSEPTEYLIIPLSSLQNDRKPMYYQVPLPRDIQFTFSTKNQTQKNHPTKNSEDYNRG